MLTAHFSAGASDLFGGQPAEIFPENATNCDRSMVSMYAGGGGGMSLLFDF